LKFPRKTATYGNSLAPSIECRLSIRSVAATTSFHWVFAQSVKHSASDPHPHSAPLDLLTENDAAVISWWHRGNPLEHITHTSRVADAPVPN